MQRKSIAAPVPPPAIDLDAARRFLDVLAPGEPVAFQTFADRKGAKGRDPLAKVMYGELKEWGSKLRELNAQGAGVFVCANATNGQGRTAADVTRVRALFIDLDGAPIDPVLRLPEDLQPHAVVESSPGRWHAYWRVIGCRLERFTELQRALAARFGGDRSVCDLPRVMRLPGFLHCKGAPFMTRSAHEREGLPFAVDALAAGLELQVGAQAHTSGSVIDLRPVGSQRQDFDRQLSHGYVQAALSYLDADDRAVWLPVGIALAHGSDNSPEALALWDEWSRHSTKYVEGECASKWRGFLKTERVVTLGLGTLFGMAKSAGWDGTPRRKADLLPAPAAVEGAGRTTRLPEPFPGPIAAFTAWVLANARRAQPEFAQLAAISTFGALAGRVYHWPDGLRMNTYALLIGPTSSGKDAPLRAAQEGVGRSSRTKPIGLPASGEGLQDALDAHAELFVAVDEAAHALLRMTGKNPSTHALSLMRELLTLFSGAQGLYALRVSAGKKPRAPIEHPAVTLIGATTPGKLGEALRGGDIVSGFLGRVLIANVDGEPMPELREVDASPMPPELRKRLDEVGRDVARVAGGPGESIVLGVEDDAQGRLRELALAFDREVQSASVEYIAELLGRSLEKVKKLAGIAAVAENPMEPYVTRPMVDWAESVVRQCDAQMLALARGRISDDDGDAAARAVMRAVEGVLANRLRLRNPQQRRLADAGYATRREVLRASRISDMRVFDGAVRLLVERGDLCQGQPDTARVELRPGTPPLVLWRPAEDE